MNFLRFIGSFIIACVILSFLSYITVELQILSVDEQERLKNGKTFWMWRTPQGKLAAIHYNEKGSGSNHIVLIHGFRGNNYTWRYLLDPLAEAGFHVWSIELVGFGFSDKPEIQYTYDLFIRQIESFMAEHDIPNAHFIGSSLGGGLSLTMALWNQPNVLSVTLLNALGYPFDPPLYITIGKHLSLLWSPFMGPSMIRKGLEQTIFDKDSITDEQVQAYTTPYYFPGGAAAALSTIKNFDNERLKEMSLEYKNLKIPLLIIWGNDDPILPKDHFNYFCNDFPEAKKMLIDNCGHLPHEEKPKEVSRAIIDFLSPLKFENRITQN